MEERVNSTTHSGNGNARRSVSPVAVTSHLLGWLLSKRHEITGVSEKVEKREPSPLLVGIRSGTVFTGSITEFLLKLKIEVLYDPAVPRWVCIQKG